MQKAISDLFPVIPAGTGNENDVNPDVEHPVIAQWHNAHCIQAKKKYKDQYTQCGPEKQREF
jgi:hypothetical protein